MAQRQEQEREAEELERQQKEQDGDAARGARTAKLLKNRREDTEKKRLAKLKSAQDLRSRCRQILAEKLGEEQGGNLAELYEEGSYGEAEKSLRFLLKKRESEEAIKDLAGELKGWAREAAKLEKQGRAAKENPTPSPFPEVCTDWRDG